ncbi:MAG: PRC-barrel domain-containing protein [Nanobdellota archaeon]
MGRQKLLKEVTSDDILGKDALDSEGEILGVVLKLHIDRKEKQLTGITIDQGFMKPNLFVGIDYVKNFGIDSIFLDYIPRTKYVGLKVINAQGNVIGMVQDVSVIKGKLKTIHVSKNKLSSHKQTISAKHIKSINTQVLLKKSSEL